VSEDPLVTYARELLRGFAWRRWTWLRDAVLDRARDEGRAVDAVLLDAAQTDIYLAAYELGLDAPEDVFRRRVFRHVEQDFRGFPPRGEAMPHVSLRAVA
jgi:hypothetical protein